MNSFLDVNTAEANRPVAKKGSRPVTTVSQGYLSADKNYMIYDTVGTNNKGSMPGLPREALEGKEVLELAYLCQVGLRRSEKRVEMLVVEGVDPAV